LKVGGIDSHGLWTVNRSSDNNGLRLFRVGMDFAGSVNFVVVLRLPVLIGGK
jgi:hypothetical protein